MRRSLLAVMLIAVAAGPGLAKVVADGQPSSGGFYWQKVEDSKGKTAYLCRKQGASGIQKSAACNGARAVKP